MKRLVICCDGTWNTADQESPTNVTRMALALAPTGDDGREQRLYYRQGVGTTRWQHLRGGAFGFGLSLNVIDAYRFIVCNFEPGDDLYFFGFSRGAFTARSTAGLVRSAGVLRRENVDMVPQAYRLYRDRTRHPRGTESTLFRRAYSHETRIRFIGVWDTVGALGVPSLGSPLADLLNRRWQFHDTDLSTYVDAAFHALAIDERRGPFRPALWHKQQGADDQVVEQVWFPGVHSDVGGGYREHAASDAALLWMVGKAREWGLGLRAEALGSDGEDQMMRILPDPVGELHDSRRGVYRLIRPWVRPLGEQAGGYEELAAATLERRRLDPSYAPANLTDYLARRSFAGVPSPRGQEGAEAAGPAPGAAEPEASADGPETPAEGAAAP